MTKPLVKSALKTLTASDSQKVKDFIDKLRADYPDFKFEIGSEEHWSPQSHTITYSPNQSFKELRYGVLHELAHALLGHQNYTTDFELLKLESEAWELAAKISIKYRVDISDEHIQNCLDTYRDWLHHRSKCPTCNMHVLQKSTDSYHCFNCQTSWKVSSGRFVRSYRKTTNQKPA